MVCGKTGIILITEFDDEYVKEHQVKFAEYIGSKPEWIKAETAYGDIKRELPKEWYKATDTNTDSVLVEKVIAVLDKLLDPDNREVFIKFNDEKGYEEGCELIKKALLCLPEKVSNSVSYCINRTPPEDFTSERSNDGKGLYLSATKGEDVDEINLHAEPRHAFTKLIHEKKNVNFVQTWKNVATVDELEATASVELLNFYISQNDGIAKAITLFSSIEKKNPQKITEDMVYDIMTKAYRAIFTPVYFTIKPQTQKMLLDFIAGSKYLGRGTIPIVDDAFLSAITRQTEEQQSNIIKAIFLLQNRFPHSTAIDFVYGMTELADYKSGAFADFLKELSEGDFIDYVKKLRVSCNKDLQESVAKEFTKRFPRAKGVKLFSEKTVQSEWLVPSVFNKEIMQSIKDLELWSMAANNVNHEVMSSIKRQFDSCFGALLKETGFMNQPVEIDKELLNNEDLLREIYSTANKFGYKEKDFVNQKVEIENYKREQKERETRFKKALESLQDHRKETISQWKTEGMKQWRGCKDEEFEAYRSGKIASQESKEAEVNHFDRGLSLRICLSFVGMLFVLSLLVLFVAGVPHRYLNGVPDVFHWEQYRIFMSGINMGWLPVKSMCLYLPVIAHLLIYGVMIVSYKIRGFNSTFIARRAAIASSCCVVLPYTLFIITMVICYCVN